MKVVNIGGRADRIIINPAALVSLVAEFLKIVNNLSDVANAQDALHNVSQNTMDVNNTIPLIAFYTTDFNAGGVPFLTAQAGVNGAIGYFDDTGIPVATFSGFSSQRDLYDCSGNHAVDFNHRQLFQMDGSTPNFNWSNGPQQVSASDVTGMASELAGSPHTLAVIYSLVNCLEQYGMLNAI